MTAIEKPRIKVYTPALEFCGMLTGYESADYTRSMGEPGTFSIKANLNLPGVECVGQDFYVDFGQGRLGLVERIQVERSEGSMGETITVDGREAKCELEKRMTIPPDGLYSYDIKNVPTESLIKQAITYFFSGAANKQFFDAQIAVAMDRGRGEVITLESRFKNLGTVLWEIAAATGIGIRCTLDTNHRLLYDTIHGIDRTRRQSINSRAVFSVDNNTLLSVSRDLDCDNYCNFVYVGGQGEGVERTIITTGDENASGRRLWVDFIDARDIGLEKKTDEETGEEIPPTEEEKQAMLDKLIQRGKSKLKERLRTDEVQADFNTGNTALTLYRDFDLGDECTIRDQRLGVEVDLQLTKVQYDYSGTGSIQLTFGGGKNALLAALNRKFSNLEGVVAT